MTAKSSGSEGPSAAAASGPGAHGSAASESAAPGPAGSGTAASGTAASGAASGTAAVSPPAHSGAVSRRYTPTEASGAHAGRPASWLAVGIMVTGFVVGGVALCIGPAWVVFWVGAAIVLAGFVLGGVVHIFSDVVVDAPRNIPEIVDYSVFGSRSAKRRGGEAGETLEKPVHTDTQRHPHG
jgi:hypothetical protein